MTQEDKDLLFKDLCARLPYGVKFPTKICCEATHDIIDVVCTIQSINSNGTCRTEESDDCDFPCAWSVRPYLFPMSSMTEEQKKELLELAGYEARCEESCGYDSWGFYVNIVGEYEYEYEDNQESIILYPDDIGIDWLNKNMFDWRGLIPKGLANDATGKNIY